MISQKKCSFVRENNDKIYSKTVFIRLLCVGLFEYCKLVAQCFCISVKNNMYAHFSWHFQLSSDFSIEMVVTTWKSSKVASSDKFAEEIQTCFGQVGSVVLSDSNLTAKL